MCYLVNNYYYGFIFIFCYRNSYVTHSVIAIKKLNVSKLYEYIV